MSDSTWNRLQKPVSANVGGFCVFHKATARPYIVFYALRNIKSGEELFVDCGTKAWEDGFDDILLASVDECAVEVKKKILLTVGAAWCRAAIHCAILNAADRSA
jgi:hypothetical protein